MKTLTVNMSKTETPNTNYVRHVLFNGQVNLLVVKQKTTNGLHSLTMVPIPAKFKFKFTRWIWFKWVSFLVFIHWIK